MAIVVIYSRTVSLKLSLCTLWVALSVVNTNVRRGERPRVHLGLILLCQTEFSLHFKPMYTICIGFRTIKLLCQHADIISSVRV